MTQLTKALDELQVKGYLNLPVPERKDLKAEINRLRREKNAIILAHYYQQPEIQDIADFTGDSLGLSRQAASTNANMIVFAGVHFMAETAKILNPDKKVVLPDLNASCSLADSCPPDLFRKFREDHPDHVVVSYINTTAEIKALSDIICTSTNALAIIESIPEDTPIIFAPDKNLGAYLKRKSGREMLIWDGSCIVHQEFSAEQVNQLKVHYPGAKIIAHPECGSYLLEHADFIGSTGALLRFTREDPADVFIVATETGILHQMSLNSPDKHFIPAPAITTCTACQECPYMKLNTMEKLYLCMKYETPEIIIEKSLRQKALKPIERMLEISARAGIK